MPIGATQARECLCWAPVLRLCPCLGVTPPRIWGGGAQGCVGGASSSRDLLGAGPGEQG